MNQIAKDQEDLSRKNTLMIQVTDYLFEKGHRVSRPMMWDIAEFMQPIIQATYEQGKIAGRSEKSN